MPSPFETIASATDGGEKAIPVHHDAEGANVKGPLEANINEHNEALRNYMGRIVGGQTLHPDEYHDYESRMKEKSHDSMLLERLNKQHDTLERRGKTDKRRHEGQGAVDKASELLNEYNGGSQ